MTDAPAPVSPAQAILDTIPVQALPAPAGQVPEGLEAGHLYAYRGGSRMGTVYVAADGRMTSKPNGGGMPHAWAQAYAPALVWTHLVATCPACAR
jgi:hypothetical protein